MINTTSSVSSISQSLARFSDHANRISNPDIPADVGDIVALKEAGVQTEVAVAVLKKILDTTRAVDIVA